MFATKACIDNQKKNLLDGNISSICPHNMVNFGPLMTGSVGEFGASQQILTGFVSWLHYCTDVAQRRSTKPCRMFGCLLGWYTIYTFSGALAPWQNFVSCKIHFASKSCVLQYWQRYCTPAVGVSQSLRHGTRNGIIMKLLQRSTPRFGRAAITLGIGPDSSLNIMHLLIMQWCLWRSSNSSVVANAKLILFTDWFKSDSDSTWKPTFIIHQNLPLALPK